MNNYERELEDSEYTIDLFILIIDLWKGVKKFWWLVIVLTIISSIVTFVTMDRTFYPYYKASATFTVNLSNSMNGSIYEDTLQAEQMSKTFPYIITSGLLKNLIAADLGEEYITESISAENVEDTNLFTLNVISSDAERANKVLQSVIKNYPKIAVTVVGGTQLTMLDETGVPEEPENKPSINYSIKMGALPGMFLGGLIIFIYAFTRRTIQKIDDLTEVTNMKHLGLLPEIRFKKRRKKLERVITTLDDKISPWFKENIYKIRTRVGKAISDKDIKTILITSAISGEGKSTFAFNYAMALAETGKKVVLIDGDLRHPSIQKMTGYQEETYGLNEVLKKEVELVDAVKFYEDLGISILAGSKTAENPAELMASSQMKEIIEQLEETADYVILDSAPASILSDTSDLAKYADGVIYVIKQDYAKTSQILEGIEYLTECSSIEFIGCVLNNVKKGIEGYGYGYGYGYGRYGGSYGYGRRRGTKELISDET